MERVSHSALSAFAKSPQHYLLYKTEKVDTKALSFGRALHCFVLQPDEFKKKFAVAPEVDKRTKEGKLKFELFEKDSIGLEVITAQEFETIKQIKNALYQNTESKKILNRITQTEQIITWIDEENNIEIKGIIDGIGDNFIFDLKTTENASPNAFKRSFFDYGYHRQAAIYLDGSKANGIKADKFWVVAVEKKAPFGIACFEVSNEVIEYGRSEYKQLIYEFKKWVEDGMLSESYNSKAMFGTFEIDLPNWMKK